MKKLIIVLFTLMLSNSVFALGEMGKGECIASDNGSRKTTPVLEEEQEVATTTSQEDGSTQSQ